MRKLYKALTGLVAVAVVALVIAGFADRGIGAASRDADLPVAMIAQASELPFDQPLPKSPGGQRVRFAGGWSLTSGYEEFGGFSGLLIDDKSKILLAISDKGDWWQTPFDVRRFVPPTAGIMRRYAAGTAADKKDLDAESLIKFNDGYLVSFEHNLRLEFVAEVGEGGTAPPLATIDFAGVSMNSGMEAIARLRGGQLLAFSERGRNGSGQLKAWLVSSTSVQDLWFQPPANFAPTDAATLPNGDVLVLLRYFSAIDGVAIKVHRIKADDIATGSVLTGEEILHLTPEFTVDNMEGLDVVALDDDTVRLVMISDDNFNSIQRTLLMMFDYDYR